MRTIAALTCLLSSKAVAQFTSSGNLSGGFESNTTVYLRDPELQDITPDDRLGSNNYLKLDYSYGKFTGTVMYEAYLPVLQGLPQELNGQKISFRQACFTDKQFEVTAGDFYEQFGNGLVFRAFEERQLGINNSMDGIRIAYRTTRDRIRVKAFIGRPRAYMGKSDNLIRGLDVSFRKDRIPGLKDHILTLEGSYVNKYERYTGTSSIVPSNLHLISGRGGWEYGRFFVKGEYAYKTADPALYNNNLSKDGSASLVEAGYTASGTAILITVRRLEYMDTRSSRTATGMGEMLSYLPALTHQYTYGLTNLNPYGSQGNNEIGGKFEASHLFKGASESSEGILFNAAVSQYHDLKGTSRTGYQFTGIGKELLFREINLDATWRVSKKIKTTVVYSDQVFNPETVGIAGDHYKSKTAIIDLLYQVGKKKSARFELGHLWSRQDNKNWVSLQMAYYLAPRWSVFAGDMFNYGDTGTHYYQTGVSYSRSRTRVAFNYGRNRRGYQCVGGICRLMPAYTGINISMLSSF